MSFNKSFNSNKFLLPKNLASKSAAGPTLSFNNDNIIITPNINDNQKNDAVYPTTSAAVSNNEDLINLLEKIEHGNEANNKDNTLNQDDNIIEDLIHHSENTNLHKNSDKSSSFEENGNVNEDKDGNGNGNGKGGGDKDIEVDFEEDYDDDDDDDDDGSDQVENEKQFIDNGKGHAGEGNLIDLDVNKDDGTRKNETQESQFESNDTQKVLTEVSPAINEVCRKSNNTADVENELSDKKEQEQEQEQEQKIEKQTNKNIDLKKIAKNDDNLMGKGKSPEVKEKNIEEIAESSSSLTAAAPSNNLGHLSQEAAPVFDFQKFLAQLKTKNCEPILRFLKSFLYQFQTKNIWTVDEQIKLIKDFEKFIYDKFVLIKQIDEDKNEYEADFAKEGFEKLIMSKLYLLVFPPAIPPKKLTTSHKEDLIQDLKLAENLVKFQWLEPRHLDLPESLMLSNSSFIKLSCIEINKLNNYKSPRDKIICVLNCCKVIFGLIRQSQHKNKVEENADSFIPLLIYVIIKAKPKNLISNINYIERFRNEKFLTGEISYYLSSLQIVSNFVINIERKLLTIDEEEFERHIIEYEEKSKKEKEKRQEEQEQKQKHDLDHDQETKSNQEQNSSNGIFAPFPQQLTSLMVGNKNSNRANEQSPSQLLANSASLLQNKISNIFSLNEEPEENLHNAEDSHANHQSQKDIVSSVKELSIQEHEARQNELKTQEETIDNLLAMFPEMARDIVRDIVIAKHCNIGDCVDVCLDLQA